MFGNLFRKNIIRSEEEIIEQWEKEGKPVPPPHLVKQKAIEEHKKKFDLSILVETGTYLGDMVEAQRNNFKKIYSIELSEKLFRKTVNRFKPYPHIQLLLGDSGAKLNEIVPGLDQPALFWLDGHYSGGITALGSKECPVPEELQAIFE